ncbi:hypothetical protein [Desulfovibrio sp. TomC]|uniref:hypothetical protein n=1 Tax=Desulfovibrio sp. TomC TaxID=1562888 RepID=UPI0005750E0E|nr:hypothetical protein [Desulfovibrio sp. TomC]KHK01260.1 hypothetical protein NY78_3242 [Desulfovibrio sp. TomC]
MHWITITVTGLLAAGSLAALLALCAKTRGHGIVPGGFDFDRYKASELSKRGLFNKARWH